MPLNLILQRTSTASKANICVFFSSFLQNHSLPWIFLTKSYNFNCAFLAFFPDSFSICLPCKCWGPRILSLKLFSILPGYSCWFPDFHHSIHKVMIIKSIFSASTLPLISRHDYIVPPPYVLKATGTIHPKLNHYFFSLSWFLLLYFLAP